MVKENRVVIVGSRGSKLALIQANWVISELKRLNPSLEFQIEKYPRRVTGSQMHPCRVWVELVYLPRNLRLH